MGVDWGQLTPQLREGDWTCVQHGRVEPRMDTLVPSCPQCGDWTLRAVWDHKRGYLVHAEPRPQQCGRGHVYRPGLVRLGWRACHCPPVVAADGSGHRTWMCDARVAEDGRECRDVQVWPPCEEQPNGL